MRIVIIGYGKLGRAIAQQAEARGHKIVAAIDIQNVLQYPQYPDADVAIECTSPETAVENIRKCFAQDLPVVCGTTGWYAQYETIKAECLEANAALLTATNFSIGVNLVNALNRQLAKLMNNYKEYKPELYELHHVHKLDAPSGTAITLANELLTEWPHLSSWQLSGPMSTEALKDSALHIEAERSDEAPGTHTVRWHSKADTIEISHIAHNRSGFALGAVLAAEWLQDKKGVFGMRDVLGI